MCPGYITGALWSLREVKECQTSSVIEHQEQFVCKLFIKAVHLVSFMDPPALYQHCVLQLICSDMVILQ